MSENDIALRMEQMAKMIASAGDFQAAQMDDYVHATVNAMRQKLHDLMGEYKGDVGSASFAYFVSVQVVISVSLGIALAERDIDVMIPADEIPEEIKQRAAALCVSLGMICAMMLKDGKQRSNPIN